ncbi:MAG: hypothetical protein ACK4KW_14025 [Gemmobacter sp.]
MSTTVLVYIRLAIVAEDVAATLREALPDADILVALSEAEAAAAVSDLPDGARVALAFLEMGPEPLNSGPLGEALRRRSAQIVLLGPDAEDQPSPIWPVLRRPFSDFDVRELVRRMLPRKPA